jgi:peptidoglycan/LPS O-acetylase OafA/YrhL
MRGLFSLWILFSHIWLYAKFDTAFLNRLRYHGDVVVSFFFLVSGFILFMRLSEESKTSAGWRSRFYIRRAFRILPLWWAVLIVFTITQGLSLKVFLANLFLTSGIISYEAGLLPIGTAWSLFVEETFYVMVPWLVPLLRRGWILLIALPFTLVLAKLWLFYAESFGVPSDNAYIIHFPIGSFQYFVIGIAFCYLYKQTRLKHWLEGCSMTSAIVLDVAGLFLFLSPLFAIGIAPELSCAAMMPACLCPRSMLYKLFSLAPLRRLGILCYGIYIAQIPIFAWYGDLLFKTGLLDAEDHTAILIYRFTVPIVVIGFAEISWRYWEHPWQRLGEKLIQRRVD